MFGNINWLHNFDKIGKFRPYVLPNIEKILLYRAVYLGFDRIEYPNCSNKAIVPHLCHSLFCNAYDVKYAKLPADKLVVGLDKIEIRYVPS